MRLTHHRLGVDLAHVPAAVSRAHIPQAQRPRPVSVLDADTVVLGYHVTGYCENCLGVYSEPRHLFNNFSYL